MKRIHLALMLSLTIILTIPSTFFGQKAPYKGKPTARGIITGIVKDNATNKPLEYANIVLFRAKDSTIVNGTVTNVEGTYKMENVKFGNYYLEFDFIGYRKEIINDIQINRNKRKYQVDTVFLHQAAQDIEGVEVTGDRVDVEYKVDKKVINVGEDYSSQGGSAVEVLEKVPSIQVDIEGNVELRGSGNFRVLINGKPSVLEGSDALKQLAANRIKNIEIITNPSAKYDPEGTAGIINVITKKQREKGFNGMVKATAGTNDKYDASVNVNYQTGKFNFFGSMDYRDMNFEMEGRSERDYFYPEVDSITSLDQDVTREMNRSGYSVKTGVDYQLTPSSTVSLTGKLGNFGFGHDMERKSIRTVSAPNSTIDPRYSLSNSMFDIDHDYYSVSLDYQNKFNDKGHQLDGSIYYTGSSSNDENSWADNPTNASWELLSNNLNKERTIETGKEDEMQLKLDYTKPTATGKLEAGYMGSYDYSDDEYEVEVLNGNNWNPIDSAFNSNEYERTIHALYATYNGKFAGIDYKFGLRTEYTDRRLTQEILDKTYRIDRFDLFPSAHLSKKFTPGEQIFLSYSRRIRRPRSWYLDPFPRYADQYTKRVGNPGLEPEYTNSYELGYKKSFNKSFISVETYYRNTTNEIDRISERGEGDELIRTFANLDNETSFGVESMINTSLFKWWDVNASGSLYRYTIEGNVTDQDVSAKSNNWNVRLNNTFKLPTETRLQFMAGYRGPSVTSQGEREGFLMSSAAIKQSFLDNKMSVTLSVRDPLMTMQFERTTEGPNFETYNKFEMESPIFRLSLSYSFNNYKRKKHGINGEANEYEGMGEF